ncbi:MAG: metal ABC transporter ATP-binding protein [Lautropia sp.]|nr:metal ABC transporter ATP-binding protein [Lautropia sp.]
MSAGPAVVLADVALQLGASRILKGIGLEVGSGEVHALVGPNGCGKSCLMKTVLGLMPHTGEVRLHWPGARPGVVAYVPQSIECDRTLPMTVQDFLACMLQARPLYVGIRRDVRERIHEALSRVGMASRSSRRMGDLSGGERQRVLLAQSLLPPAQLVLLDEPMAALDQAGMAVFERLLQDWRRQGATVLWVEHDMMAVRRLADRVTALSQGQRLWTAGPEVLADAGVLLKLFARQHASQADEVPGGDEGASAEVSPNAGGAPVRRAA